MICLTSLTNDTINFMKQYIDLLKYIMENGRTKPDRSGFGLRSTFGYMMRFNLNEGFPLVTTKKMFFKGIKRELLWFISGDTNVRNLAKQGVHIWDGFADKNGEVGPVYGYQWRKWPDYKGGHVDQLEWAIEEIKHNPNSKAIIVNAWNAAQIKEMALPPCHTMFQFYVRKDELSLMLYQRSGDAFLGIPFNIAQYSLLLAMVAQVTGLKPFEFIHIIGDAHVYKNHKEQVLEQIQREPLPLPNLWLNPEVKDIDDFKSRDIKIFNYKHFKTIKAPIVLLSNVERNLLDNSDPDKKKYLEKHLK